VSGPLLAFLLLAAPSRAGDWRSALAPVAARRDALAPQLDAAFKELRARVAAERPELLPRLDGQPGKPQSSGYGVLGPLAPDNPDRVGPAPDPGERHYAIAELPGALDREQAGLADLRARIAKGEKPLDALVDQYLEKRTYFNTIDSHVKYHQAWQPQAEASPAYYQGRNALLADYRLWRSTSASEADKQAARRRLEDGELQFSPSPGLRIEGPAGRLVLRVPMQTDIPDEAYLKALETGVESHWNASAPMKAAGLRIEIQWKRRSPRELYPEGPPAKGAAIDVPAHLGRFGPQALIMTTGASATQGYPNRAIVLGPGGIGPHDLAHEFAHILGFLDGYLRAYDGGVKDPDGVVFWEVTPFPGDLLSDPNSGNVTDAMVRKLLGGYGAATAAPR